MPVKLTIWDMADACGNVTVSDVAMELGVDVRTVRKWIECKVLPARLLPHSTGRKYRLKASDVEAFSRSLMK